MKPRVAPWISLGWFARALTADFSSLAAGRGYGRRWGTRGL